VSTVWLCHLTSVFLLSPCFILRIRPAYKGRVAKISDKNLKNL